MAHVAAQTAHDQNARAALPQSRAQTTQPVPRLRGSTWVRRTASARASAMPTSPEWDNCAHAMHRAAWQVGRAQTLPAQHGAASTTERRAQVVHVAPPTQQARPQAPAHVPRSVVMMIVVMHPHRARARGTCAAARTWRQAPECAQCGDDASATGPRGPRVVGTRWARGLRVPPYITKNYKHVTADPHVSACLVLS